MSTQHEGDADADWGGAITGAIKEAEGEPDDEPNLNVVSDGGLTGAAGAAVLAKGEAAYPVLLQAAVSMIKLGEITMEQYVEGVSKLDAITDNALKIYQIPAIKNDLPGKLSEHQNNILNGLKEQLLILKEGFATLLAYPESQAVGDLETGLEMCLAAYQKMDDIQNNADTEYAAILQREKEEKAARAARAGAAEAEE